MLPPSDLTAGCWYAEDSAEPKRWRIELPAAACLLMCFAGRDRETLAGDVASKTGIGRAEADRLIETLLGIGLIRDAAAPAAERQERFDRVQRQWSEYGWVEAAEYHAGTYDYPFLDYAEGGRIIDTARMRQYVEQEPDDIRYKYYDGAPRLDLPTPSPELAPGSLADALMPAPHRALDKDGLFAILSLTFGEIGKIQNGRWQRVPMMRRTSPSGGARHPCEGYVIVFDVPGVEPGTYHVLPEGPGLETVRTDVPSPVELARMFPVEYHRLEHAFSAVIVLSCVFSRNMYRYREPRTFRTVHNDVGHLAGTAAMVATSMGVRSFVEYIGNDVEIERFLGLDGLSEGFMLTISLTTPDVSPQAKNERMDLLALSRSELAEGGRQ
ncbi:SagB/ThcOx family dehydrogenase [Sphaerisporangium sp. NPDC049002]|uniref:SagB/ThcOx family dehydrogenase n=1 Tax=Sphaerisporangium sp. NPDC049002 TaxID=3155392 RepID=UPI0033F8BCAE